MTEVHMLEEYLESHCSDNDAVLNEMYRWVNLHVMNPRMMSGPIQGKFLEFICRMARPMKVLEIGTFTGYSSICIARGIPEEARLFTIEANEEYEDIIRHFLCKAEVEKKVKLLIGDAKTIIPQLDMSFDMVFIDADKISYPLYYELTINKLNRGGYLLADNVLWNGKVLNQTSKEADTKAIQRFNDMIHNDTRVDNVLLPIRDGLMMARKL